MVVVQEINECVFVMSSEVMTMMMVCVCVCVLQSVAAGKIGVRGVCVKGPVEKTRSASGLDNVNLITANTGECLKVGLESSEDQSLRSHGHQYSDVNLIKKIL